MVAVLAALALAALTIAEGLSWALAKRNPEIALSIDPGDARANAMIATMELFGEEREPDLQKAEDAAVRALKREIGDVSALRNLGIVYAERGELDRARRIVGAAHEASKRDLGVHMWLIEDAARQGDLEAVLYQYDLALRTSRRSWSVLPDALSRALVSPDFVKPLAGRLADSPVWADNAISHIASQSPYRRNAAALFMELIESGKAPAPERIRVLLERMAAAGEMQEGFELYDAADGASALSLDLADFENVGRFPPFDWQLGREAALVTLEKDKKAIEIEAGRAVNTSGMTRWVRLPSGRQRLSVSVETDEDVSGTVTVRVSCANGRRPIAVALAEIGGRTRQDINSIVDVPRSCPFQKLEILAKSERAFGKDFEVLVLDVRLRSALAETGNKG